MEGHIWLHVLTGGTFIEPRILLQIDRTVLSSDYYANANNSTSVHTSYFITICKQDGVASEKHEVMQAHR